MATFAIVHGAGDIGWSWKLTASELQARGHHVSAPDLPCEDDAAGWWEYAETIVEGIAGRRDVVVVGHSLGGFTAPLVCSRVPAKLLVLVAGMVPLPGETGAQWWEATGYSEAAAAGADLDEVQLFLHDVEPALAAEALRRSRHQSSTPMREPWPLDAWPDVPTRFVVCRDDRFFPAPWLRDVVRGRLGIECDEIEAGHAPFLSRPSELAALLDGYVRAL